MKTPILGLALLLFITPAAGQQNCYCEGYTRLNVAQQSDLRFNDSLALEQLQRQCAGRYYEWLTEKSMAQGKLEAADSLLQLAWNYYTTNRCTEASFLNYYQLKIKWLHHRGDYKKSSELNYTLLSLAEKKGTVFEQAQAMLLLAATLNRSKNSKLGITYARRAMPLALSLGESYEQAHLLLELAGRYFWYYQDNKDRAYLDTAKMFTEKQMNIARKLKLYRMLANGYNRMNGYAHENGNYPLALRYIDSSLQILKNTNDITLLAISYGDKADVLMEQKKYTEARRFADSCLKYKIAARNPNTIANGYALIYQISNQSGNYKEAVWAMNQYLEINDSLTNAEKVRDIAELEKKYNQARNETRIKELDRKQQLYLMLAIAGFLLLAAVVFFVRQQTLKHKKHILETEQRLNRARMNPHFFFNTLAALQKFALQEKDTSALAGNLSKFSHIMRETLESTYKEYVTVEQEMEFLAEYLEVQQIRFPQTFRYTITAQESLETDEVLIPAMIIQPFVENSIEHGFAGINHPGEIAIHFSEQGKNVCIEITDNGQGLEATTRKNNEHTHISRASQIIKDRIYLLNIKLKTRAGFSINNLPGGTGVQVNIHLPLLYKNQTAV